MAVVKRKLYLPTFIIHAIVNDPIMGNALADRQIRENVTTNNRQRAVAMFKHKWGADCRLISVKRAE